VIAGDLPVDYLTEAAFNMPTFTETYRVAAVDACDRLDESKGRPAGSVRVCEVDRHAPVSAPDSRNRYQNRYQVRAALSGQEAAIDREVPIRRHFVDGAA
jgi:hypothetical protein